MQNPNLGQSLHLRPNFGPNGAQQAAPADQAWSRCAPESRSIAIGESLRAARRLAQGGDCTRARLICAEIVLHDLPHLAHDDRLLGQTIETLIHARGFQLLTRLLTSIDGRVIRVTVGGALESTPGARLLAHARADGVENYTVSESLFRHPAGDAVIRDWSEALAQGGALPLQDRSAA